MINELKEKLDFFEKGFLLRKLLESGDPNAVEALDLALTTAKLLYSEELEQALVVERHRLEKIISKRIKGYKEAQKELITSVPNTGLLIVPGVPEGERNIIIAHRIKLLKTKKNIERFFSLFSLKEM